MWNFTKSFTFGTYKIHPKKSTITFTYRVKFKFGFFKTFKDELILADVPRRAWDEVPKEILEPTLQALLLIIGINYWCVFRTRDIRIKNFSLTQEQAKFWDELYLNGLAEFFYCMKIDFRELIAFPYDENTETPPPGRFSPPDRSLLLNGAGKDSILSAEILKASGKVFDFFSFSPSPAHTRIGKLVGANTIRVYRNYDSWIRVFPGAYPSVSTFTFVATLLAELLGYREIVFSNEKSADIGNLNYLGLPVNHQWCKSSAAEKMINDYIQKYITPDISTHSLLRKYSELEIVKHFLRYPQYLHDVTSCNNYFCLSPFHQSLVRKNYWCNRCPKCIFLFACFSAFLPKKELVSIFGSNLYSKNHLLPLFKSILGVSGTKPLDCVGEPEEMILAMHYASRREEYSDEPIMKFFEEHFSTGYDFDEMARRVFSNEEK